MKITRYSVNFLRNNIEIGIFRRGIGSHVVAFVTKQSY